MQTISHEKIKKAEQILDVWKTTTEVPEVRDIIIEALQEYIENMNGLLKQGTDYEKELNK